MTATKDYVASLEMISHFKAYHAMVPFVGNHYEAPQHNKLLLVGESNYLPKKSKVHLDPDAWYKGCQKQLSDEEIRWIHCRGLLKGDWNNGGHRIYREINRCLESAGINGSERSMEHVAYMNAFQRPAREGDSIKHIVKTLDKDKAAEVIKEVVDVIEPDMVVFVSKYAWDALKSRLKRADGMPDLDFVCHPTGAWSYWNRESYAHGKRKFLHLLENRFLN
jgi:hypothetical protein